MTTLKNLKLSLQIAEEIRSDYDKARVLFDLGNLHNFFDRSSESLPYYKECLAVAEKYGDIELIMGSQGNMGEVYQIQGEMEEALRYLWAALEKGKEMNSPFIKGILFGMVGEYFWNKGDLETTYDYYKKGMEYAKKDERICL